VIRLDGLIVAEKPTSRYWSPAARLDCFCVADQPNGVRKQPVMKQLPGGNQSKAETGLAHEGFRCRNLMVSCAVEIASKRESSSWSDLGQAAIDDQFDAGDIATFVGSEKRHHFGNFVQGSGATEGYTAHDTV
jgi:hypothetical protein